MRASFYSHHENQQPVIFQYLLEALNNGHFSKKTKPNYHQMHREIKIEIVIKMASSLSAGNILSP